MKSILWNIIVGTSRRACFSRRFVLTIVGVVLQSVTSNAQGVLENEPSTPAVPAAIRPADSPVSEATPPVGNSTPLQWGPVSFSPKISYRLLYGDGILARPGRKSNTTLQRISPGIQVGLGTHWILDYSATQTYYSSSEFSDTLEHSLELTGGSAYENWLLQFAQTYNSSSATLIQTGEQTSSSSYNTAFTASYRFGTHWSLDTVLNQEVLFVEEPSPTTRNWFVTERLNYRFTPQLSTNVSIDYGYMSVTPGPDMRYIQPQAQITLDPSSKLSLSLQAGFEKRKFISGNSEDLTTSSHRATAVYKPFKYTQLTYVNVRAATPTYTVGQLPKVTRWNIILDQRLLKRLYLHTGYAEEHYSYYSTDNSSIIVRSDKGYLYNARLSTTIFNRVALTGLYQFRKLKSSDPLLSFSGSYVGFDITYRY